MMRLLLPLVLVILLAISSCQSKKVLDSEAEAISTEEVITAAEMAPTEPVKPIAEQDSLFFTYERTPCFGRCPIFKIRAYQSGYVTYEGINFVEYMGYYESHMDDKQFTRMVDQIETIDFFAFEERYDDESLMDLPSRIFVVNHGGDKKRVVARYQAPEALTAFGLFIENEFKDTQWSPVTRDH